MVFAGGDGDAEGVGERGSLQRFDLRAERCGKEICAALAGEDFEDFIEDRAKVHVEESVRFVHDEVFEAAEGEALGVF